MKTLPWVIDSKAHQTFWRIHIVVIIRYIFLCFLHRILGLWSSTITFLINTHCEILFNML